MNTQAIKADQDDPYESHAVLMPRGVVAALLSHYGNDEAGISDVLAAWDAENEARHAAEETVAELSQELDTARELAESLAAENARLRSMLPAT